MKWYYPKEEVPFHISLIVPDFNHFEMKLINLCVGDKFIHYQRCVSWCHWSCCSWSGCWRWGENARTPQIIFIESDWNGPRKKRVVVFHFVQGNCWWSGWSARALRPKSSKALAEKASNRVHASTRACCTIVQLFSRIAKFGEIILFNLNFVLLYLLLDGFFSTFCILFICV